MSITKILLADDDEDDRFFFNEAVQELGDHLSLNMVENGEELINYLNTHRENLPDFIFLDLNMPLMNGKECLTLVKANKLFAGLPVIMYSTSDNQDEIDELYALGAHHYLKKPPSFDQLKDAVEQTFNLLNNSNGMRQRKNYVIAC